MRHKFNILRWVLVIPMAIIACYAIFIFGMIIHNYIETNYCPPEDIISGFCHNNQIQMWLKINSLIFIILSVLVAVLFAAFVAPDNRIKVAWFSLCIGEITAAYMSFKMSSPLFFVSAMIGGVLSVLIIWRVSRNTPNKSLKAGTPQSGAP